MAKPKEVQEAQDRVFFDHLSKTGLVSQSAAVAGLDRSWVHKRCKTDTVFAERWATAMDTYADALEAAAYKRAVDGVDKGVWHQGVQVGTERQYSDSLLALMLKAKRAREYGDRSRMELTGADGGPVQTETSPTQMAREVLFALAVAMRDKKDTTPEADTGEDLA